MIDIEHIKILEKMYREESYISKGTFKLIKGNIPVIVSAPHSVTHFRNASVKQGEFMTGAIALILQERLNCYCITKTKNNKTDPNYDEVHPYKEAIKNLVRERNISLLIDLHIMSSKHIPAIEIGTGNGKNVFNNSYYAQVLKSSFRNFSIEPVIVDEHFTGGFKHTVSSDISSSTGIPCIQVEINWRLLNSQSEQHQINDVIDALEQSILRLINTDYN